MVVSIHDRNTRRIEFGKRGDAGDIRGELPDEALLDSDDGRQKTLQIDTSELSDDEIRRIEGEAAVSRDDARGDMHGQVELTDAERKRLDFTRTTVIEARTAKASLLSEGVSDWSAHFDPSLTTSEMADLARSTQASGGERMDTADSQRAEDRQAADMFREVQGQQCRRARDGCEDGFEEACEQLVEECDMPREEAEQLLRQEQAFDSGTAVTADGGLRDDRVLRAASHGRFMSEPPQPAPNAPGWRKATTGRFVGYEIDEHNGKRDPTTGRFRSLGPAQPISRREQIARWGDPDGGTRRPPASETDTPFGEAAFSAEATAFDVSLAPEEAFGGVGSEGVTASRPGAFDDNGGIGADLGRTRQEDAAEAAGVLDPNGGDPFELGSASGMDDDPFDMSSGAFTDDRERQGTLDVGMAAGTTEDRTGQVAGSVGFEDRRDELLGTVETPGEQSGLVEMETGVGDGGQTDLFGGSATETSGAEYRI